MQIPQVQKRVGNFGTVVFRVESNARLVFIFLVQIPYLLCNAVIQAQFGPVCFNLLLERVNLFSQHFIFLNLPFSWCHPGMRCCR